MLQTRAPDDLSTAGDPAPDTPPGDRLGDPSGGRPGSRNPLHRAASALARLPRRSTRASSRRDAVLVGSAAVGAVAGLLLGAGAAPWRRLGSTVLSGGWWWDRTLALQSTGLLLLVGAGTVVAVLATAAAGRRPARPGWRGLLRRAGALAGCQLVGVLVLGLVVNDHFDFYSSWNDLLGTGSGALVVKGAGLGGGTAPGGQAATLADRVFAAPDSRPARIVNVAVPGARTGLGEKVAVMLPPQYDEPGYAHHRFPVVLTVSGYPGSIPGMEGGLQLRSIVGGLAARGRVAPMVLVIAPSDVVPPRDTECTDIPGGPQTETYFAQDLPQWVSAHFRVDPPGHWGLLGVSTGGFCVAKLLLAHPEVFRAAVSMSGYLSPLTDITTGDLFHGDLGLQHLNDPYWRITHLPVPAVSLLLTATRQEREVYPQVMRFLHAAGPPLQTASLIRATGGHNVHVWRGELPLCLQWLSAKL